MPSSFKVPYGEFIGDPPELRRISHNSKRWFQQFPIVQNVTWQDTIKLIGDIVVYPGATLTIDAGTTIMAYPNRDIHDMKDPNRVDIIATQNMKIDPIQVKTSGGQRGYAYAIKSDPEAGAGLSISDSGLITGKPTASKDFKITVTVEDKHDALVDAAFSPTASRSFMMRVRPSVTVLEIDNITIVQNTSITPIQVSASGGQTPYTYSISDAPSGIAIHSSSGRITGMPTKAGTFTVTVTVTDAHGRTGTRSFSMTVNAPTPVSALTIAEINDITVKISTEQTNDPITPIQVSASGGQTPYTYSLSSTPATGSGLTIGSSSGRITGTPTKAGTFTLTVKVTDKVKKTATESFSMAVSLIGDFNGDGVVNLSDHTLFVAAYGLSEGDDGFNAEMDMNGDGTINTADFLIFVSHFPNADQFF